MRESSRHTTRRGRAADRRLGRGIPILPRSGGLDYLCNSGGCLDEWRTC